MTKIEPYNIQASGKILADAIKSFHKNGPVTAGMEMERFILKQDGTLPDFAAHDRFYLALRQAFGDRISVEPGAHMIELKTDVHTHAGPLAADLLGLLGQVRQQAKTQGLEIQPGSDLPGFSVGQLAANLISRIDPETGHVRRVWELVRTYQKHGWMHISNWGCGTTSIHFTHAVPDADRLYRWSKVHAALMPVYYAVFENRTRDKHGVHDGLKLRRLMQDRGLVAPYVFAAKDGNDFVDRYVDFIEKNQILTMLDRNGQDTELPRPMTFGELPADAQTLGNLLHAASVSWNVCKIKQTMEGEALKNGQVVLSSLLLEVRDLDVAERAVPAMASWLQTLTASDQALAEVEMHLESLGVPVCSDPIQAGSWTTAALQAVETDPRTLDTFFGDPAGGVTLRDTVRQIMLPMLAAAGNPAGALDLWKEAAAARTATFRVAATRGSGELQQPAPN